MEPVASSESSSIGARSYDAAGAGELEPELPPALGMVLEAGRGSLPYALIHGEPLVRCAAIALEESGIEPLDPDTDWGDVLALLEQREALVLHDALCPLAPPDFLAACVAQAVAGGEVVVGVRPVTDTIKRIDGGLVGATVDREGLLALCTPVVLPAAIARAVGPVGADLVALLDRLRGVPVAAREAPPEARRVDGPEDLRVLEALTGPPRG